VPVYGFTPYEDTNKRLPQLFETASENFNDLMVEGKAPSISIF